MLWASSAYGFEPRVCCETLDKLFQLSKYQFQIIKKGGLERNFLSQACPGIMLPHVESSIKFAIDFEATE